VPVKTSPGMVSVLHILKYSLVDLRLKGPSIYVRDFFERTLSIALDHFIRTIQIGMTVELKKITLRGRRVQQIGFARFGSLPTFNFNTTTALYGLFLFGNTGFIRRSHYDLKNPAFNKSLEGSFP
jgi:hypothetical protein